MAWECVVKYQMRVTRSWWRENGLHCSCLWLPGRTIAFPGRISDTVEDLISSKTIEKHSFAGIFLPWHLILVYQNVIGNCIIKCNKISPQCSRAIVFSHIILLSVHFPQLLKTCVCPEVHKMLFFILKAPVLFCKNCL